MGFNYAREKARFDRLWDKLRKEYKVAGMEDDAIQKLYDFDWQWFCSQRTYTNHNQQLPETVIREDRDEENSRLFQKFTSLSSLPEVEMWHSRYGWVDSLSDIRLVVTLKLLSAKDIELLTLLVIEGFNQSEIAQKWGCSQRAISKQFQKIKKLFG